MEPRRAVRGQKRNAGRRILVLVALGVGGALLAMLQTAVQTGTAHDRLHVRQASEAAAAVLRIDGLEWRAIAGEDPARIAADVQQVADEIEAELRHDLDDPANRLLLEEIDIYAMAVGDMLAALVAGDRDLALELDESRVDPAFDLAIRQADDLVDSYTADAEASERTSRMLTWVTAIVGVVAIGILLWSVWETQLRHLRRTQEAESNRRFKALVKGSRDVITLVEGDEGSLRLVSSTWGPLREFTGAEPESVAQLLPDDVLAAWRRMDARVSTEGGHHELDFSVDTTDGRTRYFECHGSPSAESSDVRVWIWRDVTTQKELELQLSHQAFHDPLTGVANRALLHDRVDHALTIATRSGRPVSLLFCDLDDFKAVNDSRGHRAGDELLRVVAARIEACVRASDTTARLGGDEFAVLLEDTELAPARGLAEEILTAVTTELLVDGHPLFPSVSIGVAQAEPGMGVDEFLRHADLAMYAAKRSGKRRVAVFDPRMDELSTAQLGLRGELRAAIDENALELHFQPTVDLRREVVEGVEALLRWRHPTRGFVPPGQFVPVAEATGMIAELGKWVLGEACREAARLAAVREDPLLMHVNLSPQQLRDPEIVRVVEETLAASGLPASLLVLEVTEGSLLDDAASLDRLRTIHDLGVQIAVDDFGTGYASINYLRKLPVDMVKIDRSFVSGDGLDEEERRSFLQAIVGLAESLRIRCVAEGIEEAEQLAELRGLGCPTGQGFLWTPAVVAAELPAVIDAIEARRGVVATGG